MINCKILNSDLTEIVEVVDSSVEYPYSIARKLYLKNEGDNDAVRIKVSVQRGLSIQNFSTPALIDSAYIIDYTQPFLQNYFELVFKAKNTCIDIANFPQKELTVSYDPDGWERKLLPNIALKLSHANVGGNSRILVSEAKYQAGVSLDLSGSPVGYKTEIGIDEVKAGEQEAFWYRYFVRRDMLGERNPRVFNILIKGVEA